jgi:hypothetical protein
MVVHEIVLEMFEIVVRGGLRRVTWHVADGKRWVVANGFPGARSENHASTPSVVWRRHIVLSLEPGTRLLRTESRPAERRSEDPLAYLWRGERGAKRSILKSQFQVSRAGALELVKPPRPSK